jgi:hypothetical protein
MDCEQQNLYIFSIMVYKKKIHFFIFNKKKNL